MTIQLMWDTQEWMQRNQSTINCLVISSLRFQKQIHTIPGDRTLMQKNNNKCLEICGSNAYRCYLNLWQWIKKDRWQASWYLIWQWFFKCDSKKISNKRKNRQTGWHHNFKLLCIRRCYQQSEKATNEMKYF